VTSKEAVHSNKFEIDPLLLSNFFLILILGLTAVMSSSVIHGEREFQDPYFYFKRQLLWFLFGIISFVLFSKIPYSLLLRFSFPLSLVSLILLVLVFFPGLGKSVSTSYGRSFQRWIQIGGIQIQPSEFCKITLLLFLTTFFRDLKPGEIFQRKNLVSIALFVLTLVLIVMEPAFGTTVEIGLVILFFSIIVGLSITRIVLVFFSLLPLAFVLVTQVGYRKKRLDIWLDPYKYKFDEGHQIVTSFRAFLDGGTFGNPIGSGFSHRYLAYSHTDFVMASFVEDFGFIGFIVFLALVLGLSYRIFDLAQKLKTKEAFLLSVGILFLFDIQILMNLYVITGLVPVTGISLPLISYGGSSLVTMMTLFGILSNVLKKENLAL